MMAAGMFYIPRAFDKEEKSGPLIGTHVDDVRLPNDHEEQVTIIYCPDPPRYRVGNGADHVPDKFLQYINVDTLSLAITGATPRAGARLLHKCLTMRIRVRRRGDGCVCVLGGHGWL